MSETYTPTREQGLRLGGEEGFQEGARQDQCVYFRVNHYMKKCYCLHVYKSMFLYCMFNCES